MKSILSLLIWFFLCCALAAQRPDTLWTKTFGGTYESIGNSISQLQNGDFLIGGTMMGNPYLLCIDSDGEEIWSKSWGNDSLHYHHSTGKELYELNTNEFVMGCGGGSSGIMWYNRATDSTIIKYYSSSGLHEGVAQIKLKKLKDNGYLVAWNYLQLNAYGPSLIGHLMKADSKGEKVWRKSYQEEEIPFWFSDIALTKENGFIILGGHTYYKPVFLMRMNEEGELVWNKRYTIDSTKYGIGKSILQTEDNGFIFLITLSDSVNVGNYLFRIDENGNTLWTKNLGLSGKEQFNNMKSTSDGGYILVGATDRTLTDMLIVKVDSFGNQQWSKIIGGDGLEYALDVYETQDGYIIVGTTYDKILVIKLELGIVGVNEEYRDKLPNNFELIQNYPNPFNPTTKISYSIPNQSNVLLTVFDVLGREITTLVNKEQTIGNYEVEFDASNLTSGIYFYRIQAGEFVESKKMVLMK